MAKNNLTTTWTHIRRTPYQALSAIAVMTLTFFIAAVFALLTLGSNQILHYLETRPQVTAFFEDSVTSEQVDQLTATVENSGLSSSTKYVSKQEALAIYQQQNQDDPLLLEMVTADILPASLEVSALKPEDLPQIADLMNQAPGVEEVVYQKDVAEAVSRWTNAIRLGGGVIIGFLTLTSILIIIIIIGMRIAVRRDEIDILRLLGASPWYIKSPFLMEGALYGFIGAVIAWATSYILLLYSTPFLLDFFGTIPLLPVPVWVMAALLGAEVGLGLVIGSLGSLIAVSRFMR